MNNVTILRVSNIEKKDCCGCSACINVCPQNCITMEPDYEGFLFPSIDEALCVSCGLCYDYCPSINANNIKNELFNYKIYASRLKDDRIRSVSTSGGAFSALAKYIFEIDGIVCGVVYSDDQKVIKHSFALNWDELEKMRRSKLVQSTKFDIFSEVKIKLENNIPVLFSGTPCEIAGLKMTLNKEYKNLFTCDLICGCVASPKVYQKYIDFLETKYSSKVTSVNFKDKSQGWHNLKVNITFASGEVYSNGIYDDPYIVSFHSRYNIRTFCFNCMFRGINSLSDITLGDFWGIDYISPLLDDNKGISFILVNTSKGDYLMENISNMMDNHLIDVKLNEYGDKYNVCLTKSPVGTAEQLRLDFYNDLNSNMNFDELFSKHLDKICNERKLKKIEYFKKLSLGNDKVS